MKKRKTEGVRTSNQDRPEGIEKAPRRRLLAALGLGGSAAFLPPLWHKPMVQGLILPAHAQTSPTGPVGPTGSLTDPCMVQLVFELLPIGVNLGCTGNVTTQIIPIVTGSVLGTGNLSGIQINVQSVLSSAIGGTTLVTGTTTTDGGGNYQITLDGFQTTTQANTGGPHLRCSGDGDCQTGGTVVVTVTSPDIPGTAPCQASFDCEDIENPAGSMAENGSNRSSNRFYVEMEPVDESGRKT